MLINIKVETNFFPSFSSAKESIISKLPNYPIAVEKTFVVELPKIATPIAGFSLNNLARSFKRKITFYFCLFYFRVYGSLIPNKQKIIQKPTIPHNIKYNIP